MESDAQRKDPGAWVEKVIRDFIDSPENTMKNTRNDRAWAEPLVGFSGGDDPIFQAYKEYVGPFHWTPLEIFNRTFPGVQAGAGDLTVISWILPQMESTNADMRKENFLPSESWARARIFGEEANVKLRRHVAASLQASGYEAVAPMLSPSWERKESERFGFASTWSERHAAYACGLGTFGLSEGLITPRGKAMRCGSVVARIRIPASGRPYQDHHAYCLFFSRGICGKCISRCPADAISRDGHDKKRCYKYIQMTRQYVTRHMGFEGYGCGFCQTDVPCESKIPVKDE